MITDRRKFTTK